MSWAPAGCAEVDQETERMRAHLLNCEGSRVVAPMHNEDAVGETWSSKFCPDPNGPLRSPRPRDEDVVTFLQTAITGGTANVSELEILARASGLLGERQSISQAKQFKRAKITLGIQSVRQGFGPGGGWAWVLPPPANAPASETKPKEPLIRADPAREAIYAVGIVGAAPMASVIDDVEMPPEFCDIVGVPSSWLKGVRGFGGGGIIRLHRDWAEIQPPANGSRYVGRDALHT